MAETIESTRALVEGLPSRTRALFVMLSDEQRLEVQQVLAAAIENRAREEADRLGERVEALRSALGDESVALPPARQQQRALPPASSTNGRSSTPAPARRPATPAASSPRVETVMEALDALGGRATRAAIRRNLGLSQGSAGDRSLGGVIEALVGDHSLVEDGRTRGGGFAYKRPRGGASPEPERPDPEEARRQAALTASAARDAASASAAATESVRSAAAPGVGVASFAERQKVLDRQIVSVLGQGPAVVTQVMERLKAAKVEAPAAIVARRLRELEQAGEIQKSPPAIYRVEP